MTACKNDVQLSGILTRDPQLIRHHRGKLARLQLTTEEYHKNAKGQTVKSIQWHQLSAWGDEAEIAARFMKKGTALFVQGRLVHNYFKDKEGVRRQISEVVLANVEILG
jgi:single-strand DNA-binding protein